ncbi:hypothetical protein GP486_000050 [Trichoglossum hirsutum]|uniref:Sister chromatid cohesion protein Dcc1 n=1 Tax=Trichoglossum hirsutum TaxID=265104 RepID=A0A9P8LJQ1_9PEZI|nr:hypothetical protein GP486_000050 [Trichoglossum hirsutum]
MASQDDPGIPFGFRHNQESFRLLELSPALLAALESENPLTITIKSAPVTSSASTPSHAVLCTTDETFQLRQVHSSNSVFLIRPSQHNGSTEEVYQSPGLCTIASPKVTLELHRVAISSVSHLKKLIPIFHAPEDGDGDSEMTSWPTGFEKQSRIEIFADVPTCEEECRRGWTEIVAFELDVEDLWQTIEYDGYPRPLVDALLATLAPEGQPTQGKWASVDKSKCVPWLGALILEAQQGANPERFVSDFLKEWTDSLPEAWRASVSLDCITGHYVLSGSTIRFNGGGMDATSATPLSGANANKAPPSSRRWHEKFRNAKK